MENRERDERIRAEYREGAYQVDLGRKWRLSRQRVWQILGNLVGEYGHKDTGGGIEVRMRRERVEGAARGASSISEVVTKTGFSRATVVGHLRVLGINLAGGWRRPNNRKMRQVSVSQEVWDRVPEGNRSAYVEEALRGRLGMEQER